jgi:plastocyanin
MRSRLFGAVALILIAVAVTQAATVSGKVAVDQRGKPLRDRSGAVVWLTPLDRTTAPATPTREYRLTQKGKHFEPHLLVVPQGAEVQFPNKDPFFHNVFSLHEGVRFDLGLYESGASKAVRFSKPGASFIFCNIHPEMSSVIMVMSSPYYATSDENGNYTIAEIPPGEYQLSVWYERAAPEQLKRLSRKIVVGEAPVALDPLKIVQTPGIAEHHKNKYDMNYENQPAYKTP